MLLLLLLLLPSSPIGNKDRVTPQKTHKQQNTNKIQKHKRQTKGLISKGIIIIIIFIINIIIIVHSSEKELIFHVTIPVKKPY